MSFRTWLPYIRSALAAGRDQICHRRRAASRAARPRLRIEHLEDRSVPAQYTLTELGSLGGHYTYATDLNEAGQVVGYAGTSTGHGHAFLWNGGTMIDLGTLGGTESQARAVNDLGQVVGYSLLPGDLYAHAFLVTPQGGAWFRDTDLDGRNDLMINLGSPGGGTLSHAFDVNNAGQVVGFFNTPNGVSQAFLWDAAHGMVDLGTAAGLLDSGAYGISASGQVAGQAEGTAFLWTPDTPNGVTGTIVSLGTLPGGVDSSASAVNDAGQVVGYSGVNDQWGGTTTYAVRWAGGAFNMGTLPSGISSEAVDINDTGRVVGNSVVEDVGIWDTWYWTSPFVWDEANGMVNPLDQLAPGAVTNWGLIGRQQFAAAINDGGAIAINGFDNVMDFRDRAFLLTPVPEGTPAVSVANAPAVTEGNAGTRTSTFTVTLSAASSQPVTVAYATADGTAAAGRDYQAASGTLTFAPGQTSKTISVPVYGDRLGESDETFAVNLSSPTNAYVVAGQGTGTILDDEPRVTISDVSLKEGQGNKTTVFTFTITLSARYDLPVTVRYATGDGTAAAADGDYAATSGTVRFAPGETTKTVTVGVKADKKKEANETFYLLLSDDSGTVLFTRPRGTGTILNDD